MPEDMLMPSAYLFLKTQGLQSLAEPAQGDTLSSHALPPPPSDPEYPVYDSSCTVLSDARTAGFWGYVLSPIGHRPAAAATHPPRNTVARTASTPPDA